MAPTDARAVERSIHRLLQDCGDRWGIRGFERTVRVEWGQRFRRSLGRVHLDRRVVRLSVELAAGPVVFLREVLCHEVAHLAARDLYGSRCRPHGPEWAALVRAAGFEPRRQIPWAKPSRPSQLTTTRRRHYIHRCPVCQLQRTAWRPVRQWRCAACVAAGLPGRLEITSLPRPARA
jgi:predicted SprT family Zn-dependent metalloprotease